MLCFCLKTSHFINKWIHTVNLSTVHSWSYSSWEWVTVVLPSIWKPWFQSPTPQKGREGGKEGGKQGREKKTKVFPKYVFSMYLTRFLHTVHHNLITLRNTGPYPSTMLEGYPTQKRHKNSLDCKNDICLQCESWKRKSVTLFKLNWNCGNRVTQNFLLFCICPQMTYL